jgi:hypothetical protein
MPFKVMIEDNNHTGSGDEEYHPYSGGIFTTEAEAIAKCEKIVNDFLTGSFRPGETAEELIRQYRAYGEDPHIEGTDGDKVKVGFSAWGYAEEKAADLCKGAPEHLSRETRA